MTDNETPYKDDEREDKRNEGKKSIARVPKNLSRFSPTLPLSFPHR
jgi:hypothetical protein